MTRIPTVAGACISLAATVLLGGCSATSPGPEPEPSAERTEHGGLSDCLKSHGVTDSGGTAVILGPPAGVDRGTWDNAMKECSGLAPGPGPG